MNFSEALVAYYRGEKNEALLLALFGLLLLAVTALIWRSMNNHDLLKGLFIPVLLLTATAFLAGSFNAWNNQKRLDSFPKEYFENPTKFIEKEKIRFESKRGVNRWWLPLKVFWTLLLITGLIMSYSGNGRYLHGVALGLLLWGCFGLIVDGFAHDRAKIYTSQLLKQ